MRKLHSTPTSVLTAVLFGAGLVSILSSAAIGCASDPATIPTGTDTGTGGGGGGTTSSGEAPADKGEELFRGLEEDLLVNCGPCHAGDTSNTPWLGGEDPYVSILAWRGMVTKDWRKSKLMTIPIEGGGHPGSPNLDSTSLPPTLYPGVQAWLEEEAKAIVVGDEEGPVTGPAIEPVTPVMGFNALYLDSLGAAFQGMAITFFADTPTDNLLMLTDLQIHATSEKGLHVVHPLFVVYPKNVQADPDPVDSCSNVDQTIDIGGAQELGPGTVILSNWQPEAKLAVVFEKVEPYTPGAPVETDGCKDVTSFTTNAVGPLQDNCAGQCHGGNNSAAKAALDMSALQDDPEKACAQVLNRVKTDDPNGSPILVVTQPGGNANHPYKFPNGGYENFQTAVSTWIMAEAAAAGQ